MFPFFFKFPSPVTVLPLMLTGVVQTRHVESDYVVRSIVSTTILFVSTVQTLK